MTLDTEPIDTHTQPVAGERSSPANTLPLDSTLRLRSYRQTQINEEVHGQKRPSFQDYSKPKMSLNLSPRLSPVQAEVPVEGRIVK